jgi:hypothetical protein
MAIDLSRRQFLSAALACTLTHAGLLRAQGKIPVLRMLGAWRADGIDYAGVWDSTLGANGVELPFRAHQVLMDPHVHHHAIAIARRPGEFIARIDLKGTRIVQLHAIDPEFLANGHALLDLETRALLVAESDSVTGAGALGVYDLDSLELRDRVSTLGIGPHALLRDSDGTLLVANGGVLTLAQSGRTALNAGSIDSSLVKLDARGALLGRWRLEDPNLSIRHLARARDGTVGVALQAEHVDTADRERAPVFALFDGRALRVAQSPQQPLSGYAGDVACVETAAGPRFAVGCTRAGIVGIWDGAGSARGLYPLQGACAVAGSGPALIAPSENGELGQLAMVPDGTWSVSHGVPPWDNHVSVWRA